ncbi:MAG TPA: hypothetical protein VGB38_02810, partial [bacterium]
MGKNKHPAPGIYDPSPIPFFSQPIFCSTFSPSFQGFLSGRERFLEFLIAHVRVPEFQKNPTRKIPAQAAVLQLLPVRAAVMEGIQNGLPSTTPQPLHCFPRKLQLLQSIPQIGAY